MPPFRKPSPSARYVEEFHTAFGIAQDLEWKPDSLALRLKLMEEEFEEFRQGIINYIDATSHEERMAARVEILDAMADMEYINYGTADVLHLPLDEAVKRVHTSNMSKLGSDGKPIINGQNGAYDPTRPLGKVLKGPKYKPPVLEDLVG